VAVPKRRVSHSRTHKRKAQWLGGLSAPAVGTCPRCGETLQAHHACKGCGYYRGRKVLEVAEPEKK
jgi:large subunit ribosomal protein L32